MQQPCVLASALHLPLATRGAPLDLLMSESSTIRYEGAGIANSEIFVGSGDRATRLLENALANISATDVPVLLMGESGVGKQVFARHIHESSCRRNGPLLRVSCGEVRAEELSSRLAAGRNEGGMCTLLLDEIADLDRECQRKLLYMVPNDLDRRDRVPARIVSTSSQNLEEEVRTGRFRNDLYHRLNGVCLRIPPLRERREDIPTLLDFFLSKHSVRLGKQHATLSTPGMARLLEHGWPGNIRELENLAIRVLAVGDEDLALSSLGTQSPVRKTSEVSAGRSLKAASRAASRSAERELILSALSRTQWNRKRAAQELQISYKSLLYKLKQIGSPNSESEQ